MAAPAASAPPRSSRHTHGTATVGDVLYAKKWRMPFKNGIHLQGYSRGHDVTCFFVPEWRVQLDVGALQCAEGTRSAH